MERKFIFRSEKSEFEALCSPARIRQAAAVTIRCQQACFMEIVDVQSNKTLMVVVRRDNNPGSLTFLFPE